MEWTTGATQTTKPKREAITKACGRFYYRRDPRTKYRGEGLGILRGNEDRGRVRGVPWETAGAAVGELRWGTGDETLDWSWRTGETEETTAEKPQRKQTYVLRLEKE